MFPMVWVRVRVLKLGTRVLRVRVPSTQAPTLHSTQQRADSEQEWFSTGLLTLCMEETWEHVSVHWHRGNYQLWENCCMCCNPAGLAVSQNFHLPCQANWWYIYLPKLWPYLPKWFFKSPWWKMFTTIANRIQWPWCRLAKQRWFIKGNHTLC